LGDDHGNRTIADNFARALSVHVRHAAAIIMRATGTSTHVTSTDITSLSRHAARLSGIRIADLFAADASRITRMSRRLGAMYLDASRQLIDADTWQALLDHARAAGVEPARDALLSGAIANPSEGRAALHGALRAGLPEAHATGVVADARRAANAALGRMAAIVESIRDRPQRIGLPRITDVVSIGIGGSDLGPRLACEALRHERGGGPRVHFLANVDGDRTAEACATLDPASTIVIVISKSFGTQETLLNGSVLRDWLVRALGEADANARLFAVTANTTAAARFGIAAERVLPMWDYVGGRYSVWSAVGLPLAIAIGMDGFRAFLAGARALDEHFATAPLGDNLPVWLALVGWWNRDFLGRSSVCVVPYDDRLESLPDFLQQLEMESNGKRVRPDGSPVELPTVPVVWGSVGSNAQHAYFQALHQGTDIIPMDFIGVVQPHHALADNHRALLANLLAQSAALMTGKTQDEAFAELWHVADAAERQSLAAQKTFPGNRPSTTILLDRLDPHSLGMLLALYEHKVFVQSVLWGINAFDQWGVELGKTLATRIEKALVDGDASALDASTAAMLAQIDRVGRSAS
jgi:glucose-6-phosphate isomerase